MAETPETTCGVRAVSFSRGVNPLVTPIPAAIAIGCLVGVSVYMMIEVPCCIVRWADKLLSKMDRPKPDGNESGFTHHD